MTRDEYVEYMKSAFAEIGKKAIVNGIAKRVSSNFLGKVVGAFAGPLAQIAMSLLLDEAEILVFFLYTDFRVSQQGNKFVESAKANWLAQQGTDKNAKKAASEKLKQDFADFARLTS